MFVNELYVVFFIDKPIKDLQWHLSPGFVPHWSVFYSLVVADQHEKTRYKAVDTL